MKRLLFLVVTFFSAFPGKAQDCVDHLWLADKINSPETKATDVDSVSKVLKLLPPDLMSRYVLLYRSAESDQLADPSHPRAFVFSEDAKFILAFNGNPELRGYDVLDMISFNDAEKKFEFYEGKVGKSGRLEITRETRCSQCHRADMRPNWMPYAQWPGAYDSQVPGMQATERADYQKEHGACRHTR